MHRLEERVTWAIPINHQVKKRLRKVVMYWGKMQISSRLRIMQGGWK